MKLTHEKIENKFTFRIIKQEISMKQGSDIGFHWHGNMEMIRIIEGQRIVTISGKSYLFDALGNPVSGLQKVQIANTGEYTSYFFVRHNLMYEYLTCHNPFT